MLCYLGLFLDDTIAGEIPMGQKLYAMVLIPHDDEVSAPKAMQVDVIPSGECRQVLRGIKDEHLCAYDLTSHHEICRLEGGALLIHISLVD